MFFLRLWTMLMRMEYEGIEYKHLLEKRYEFQKSRFFEAGTLVDH
jgi:hypothetical protein